jgi:ABC-type polysaccharide/polyol phosphate transport system ATPase subunit
MAVRSKRAAVAAVQAPPPQEPIVIDVNGADVVYPLPFDASRSILKSVASVGVDKSARLRRGEGDKLGFQAITNLNLTIRKGERVALVGRNGSGKTTLLRLLGGALHASRGRVQVEGSVGCLYDGLATLDLEKTGFSNIDFFGRVYGLSEAERQDLRDDVEAFTELKYFLTMPVYTYSAGMLIRLSFALLTAVSHDVLLIDEALGAGDAHFTHKAQKRSREFTESATTLVLASHSDALVRELCTRAIWLQNGKILMDGGVDEVLGSYAAFTGD